MFLCTQYYRPPFPNRKYWADDLSRMRDAGLHALQLWVMWGWVEAEPGRYRFDDYDELFELADKRGLKVVLSTIAEIHPFWIHRLVPDSHLVDHLGREVVSVPRRESNCGLTPGGCFDHPRVLEMMGDFLDAVARQYASAGPLIGWDCWNETRWTVMADGHTCYCPHTLGAWRQWLSERHGGLEGLNEAWHRRYVSWEDVRPTKVTGATYCDMIEFLRFLTVRATRHAKFRYDRIAAHDTTHPITAHCGQPAIQSGGATYEQALCRGVDWDLADQLDGFGCSHFPFWGEGFDEAGFGIRVEASRSATPGKVCWVSELQGGSARQTIGAHRSVEPTAQQRWIANAMARGAKGVIFWCWRDEVFGRESSGFGLDGWDGMADARRAAMAQTGTFIDAHDKLIDAYQPDPTRVGVLFVPDAYLLDWSDAGNAWRAVAAVNGYARTLENLNVPYDFVEARHLDRLGELKVLLVPWPLLLPESTRKAIVTFVRNGGTVFIEGEADAFDEQGFYSYPDERTLARALGIRDQGRRILAEGATLPVEIDGQVLELPVEGFLTPLTATGQAETLAHGPDGEALMVRKSLAKGTVYYLGTFAGGRYWNEPNRALERLVEHVVAGADALPALDVTADGEGVLQWRTGLSGRQRLLWLINGGPERTVHVTDRAGLLARKRKVTDISAGADLAGQAEIPVASVNGSRTFAVAVPAGGYKLLKL